ncbi:DNA polymerase III subunit gamma/tau [Candidatus Saccharibacteria bacterium]|nr:DNA polymerase III subunit gamma/tau [Candidatus Saccharibacteria bacterium]
MKLDEVVGQEQVTAPLISSLKAGKISHAYLFVGPRGCGKTSVARILAHEVNGFKYEVEDDYVDIIEIDGASNRGIDNIRELREKVMIAPTAGKYKVYIIDEVHMLTKEAFNALLKTLEEPPAHVIFIMATTDAYKVPVTITSRAQTFEFKLADKKTMFNHLKSICEKEQIKISDEALEIIVKRGGGSFRDSLSLLDQISTLSDKEITKELVVSAMGLPDDEKIVEILTDYAEHDVVKITTDLKELLSSGVKPETLAEEMIETIIDNPTMDLLPLLAKLPDVKAPFGEAKLLVALMSDGVLALESRSGARPSGPSPRADGATPRAAALRTPLRWDSNATPSVVTSGCTHDVAPGRDSNATPSDTSSGSPRKVLPGLPDSNATPSKPIATKDFDWDGFLDRVKGMNDAIYLQLLKVEYTTDSTTLNIFPKKKIVKTILSRDNNKKILIEAASGLKVIINDVGDNPNAAKDELISKISDIMGGEVQNDSGGSPF